MAIRSKLGVQSWCFHRFPTHGTLIPKLKELGLDTVELCGVQTPFENPAVFATLMEPYRRAGISVDAVGVVPVRPDDAKAENAFRFAKEAGAKVVHVHFTPTDHAGAVRRIDALTEKYGLKAAVHNHGAGDWLGNEAALDYVMGLSSQRLGLCLDTAWAMDSGMDPLRMMERFRDRLHGIHLKDFVFDRAGVETDVVIGTGNLDLAGVVKFLGAMNYDGALTLEYEGEPENPVPSLMECVGAFRSVT